VTRAGLVAALAVGAVAAAGVLSGCGGGAPAKAGVASATSAAGHPCRHEPNFSIVNAKAPASLVAALPVLARTRTQADEVPMHSLPIAPLVSRATGIELHSARVVRSSPFGGHAWVVPVLHDAPPVARTLACLERQIAMRQKFVGANPHNSFQQQLLQRELAQERAARTYVASHGGAGGPGVLMFTTFKAVQGADATLSQLRAGEAFAAGACAGPGHNLLIVSGLAPAPTATIELRAPNGATQTQRVRDGAYEFLFAPAATRAGLPNRIVLLDRRGHALHTLPIPAASLSTHPQCAVGQPHGGPRAALPAGSTIVASSPRGPFGVAYTIGATSGGGPECDPSITIEYAEGGGGGSPVCDVSFTASSLTPTFSGGGCGPQLSEIDGAISTTVKRLRFTTASGRTLTTPVFAVPANIAPGYGVVLAIGPTAILGTNPTIQSLDARGRTIATEHNALQAFGTCYQHFTTPPATVLAPGIVNAVTGTSPHHTPWILSLQRLRYATHTLVCPELTPQGSSQCFPAPGETTTPQGNPTLGPDPPVRLTPGNEGTCTPPRFNVISGLVMRPRLTIYLQTPTGTRRIPLVHVDPRFQIPGGVFATQITRGPVTLIAKNTAGATVYTAPVTNRGDKASFCGGLDGGNPPLSKADAQRNLQPRPINYPLG
jgi:hypothetical protein